MLYYWKKWVLLLLIDSIFGQNALDETLFEKVFIVPNNLDSKVTISIEVRTKVECGAYASVLNEHGFRMRDGDTTCQLMNLQWTELSSPESGDAVYIDSSIQPVHTEWTAWDDWNGGNWGDCNQPCDSGWQYKYRSCPEAQYRGVKNCPGSSEKSQICNTHICPRIVRIDLRTTDEEYASMKDEDAGMRLAIRSRYGETCWTRKLDNAADNYQRDSVDIFDSDDAGLLYQCWNFRVPDHDIHFIRVQHEGSDSWKGDWVDIHFNFGDTYRCPSGDKRWYLFKDDYEHAYCDPK